MAASKKKGNSTQRRDAKGRFADSPGGPVKRAEFLRQGLRGQPIPKHLLNPAAMKHIRTGGRTFGEPSVRVFSNGRALVTNGRNRIAVAREQGKKTIKAHVESRAGDGTLRWQHRGKIKI